MCELQNACPFTSVPHSLLAVSLVVHPHWGRGTWGMWFSLAKPTLSKAPQAAWLCNVGKWCPKPSTFPTPAAPTQVCWVKCVLAGEIASPLCHTGCTKKIWNSQMSRQWAKVGKQALITLQVHLAAMQTSTITIRAIAGKRDSLTGQIKLKVACFQR